MTCKRGFTLLEIVIASFLALVVLGVLILTFLQFRRAAERPLATVGMEQSTLQLVSWLQRDLLETNLQSLYSLPNQSGVVMESARDASDKLVMAPATPPAVGTVVWQKFLYYQVREMASTLPLPDGLAVGELTRDEDLGGVRVEPGLPNFPLPTSFRPDRHRVLAHNVMIDKRTGQMGCHLYFNDAGGDHPYGTLATQRGEPVTAVVTLLDVSSRTGKPTVRHVQIRVKPRN